MLFASCNNDTDGALSVINEQAEIDDIDYTHHVDVIFWAQQQRIELKDVDEVVLPPRRQVDWEVLDVRITILDYDKLSAAKDAITSIGIEYIQIDNTIIITETIELTFAIRAPTSESLPQSPYF
ncbi:hypothetical protein Barb4_03778 [Bacteroidales bacterium Barb4]|nr:hypothetical protein Barb4_03778 [Bacteroidales bacterium Barb4]